MILVTCCAHINLYELFQLGRKLVVRSEPPQAKKEKDDGADLASKEEEELAYYFTPWNKSC